MSLLDFEKAFDKVQHSRLLYKLGYYGIQGPVCRWIQSFLRNRTQRVVLEGTKSTKDDVLSGVPQGTVLEPLHHLTSDYLRMTASCTESDPPGGHRGPRAVGEDLADEFQRLQVLRRTHVKIHEEGT